MNSSSVVQFECCWQRKPKSKKVILLQPSLSVLREIAISVPLTLPHLTLHPFLVLIWGLLDPVLQCVLSILVFPYIDHCGVDLNLNYSRKGRAFKTKIFLNNLQCINFAFPYQKVRICFPCLALLLHHSLFHPLFVMQMPKLGSEEGGLKRVILVQGPELFHKLGS